MSLICHFQAQAFRQWDVFALSCIDVVARRLSVRTVPLQVVVLLFPIPTAKRCFKLGKALRRAEGFPEDIKVAALLREDYPTPCSWLALRF